MYQISVIIVSWNAKQYVEECLVSLSEQKLGLAVEIILVDNASTDGTPEMVVAQFPSITLVRNTDNVGFASANNIGIRRATGKYICLINSDVKVSPLCLQQLYDFMEEDPSVGMLGPGMLVPGGTVARSYMRFPTVWNCTCRALLLDRVFKGSRMFGGVLMSEFDGVDTACVDVLNGWFLAVRRRALEEVGLLDERFFMYGEDIDWSQRFQNAGWKRVYFPKAQALHYGGASSQSAGTHFYIEMHKANLQYWKKYRNWYQVCGYRLTVLLHHILRATGYCVISLLGEGKRAEARMKMHRSIACLAWLIGARTA